MSHPAQNASLTEPATHVATDGSRIRRVRSFAAVVSGNFLEWFDWTVYAVFTPYIAANFFDPGNPTSAVLNTLAIFAVGFLARPLGGYLLGRFGDLRGRKSALVVAMTMMAIGSLLIAILPTFEQVGVWASLFLLVARLLQGLAHGGESGNSYSYLAEIAPKDKRGLWGSSIMFTITLGVMAATALGAGLTSVIPEESMDAWGWRIPFIIGGVLALFALYLRRAADESPFFEAVQRDREMRTARPVSRHQLTIIAVRILALGILTQVLYYTWMSFFSSYAISAKGMDKNGAYVASLCAQIVALIALPLWGAFSDRVGRRRTYYLWAGAVIVVVLPISRILTDQPWSLFLAQSIALIVWAMQASIHSTVMAEQAPTEARSTSVGIWTSVAAAATGGTAPYLNTWLTLNDKSWIFSAYIIGLAVITLVALRWVPETAGLEMDEIPLPGEPTPMPMPTRVTA